MKPSGQTASPKPLPARNRLLVLDDDAAFGAKVLEVARRADFEADFAATPEDFRRLYVERWPNMLVLDIVLGEADVCEVLDFLVAMRCEAPVLLVSGHDVRMRQFVASLGRGLLIADTMDKRDGLKRIAFQLNAYRVR